MGKEIEPLVHAHAPLSGIYGLRDARDAFAARVELARAADRTLDVQYYIWNRDLSGTLLIDELRNAADRGVRVRLLLDDNNTSGLDDALAALDAHRNIEVRLFNPFAIRTFRPLSYLTDFARLNRRMHNKSFTADNQAAIVGGRNVGDEYFAATTGVLFEDLDVLAIGPVVRQVSAEFDRYWSSALAYPADRIIDAKPANLAAEAAAIAKDPLSVSYLKAIADSSFMRQLNTRTLTCEWAPVRMISDDPAKALGRVPSDELLLQHMRTIFGRPSSSIDLVSPYFVPGDEGVAQFCEWAKSGVRVRILTNALEATDVAAVHAGYAKRRKALLPCGITLYELRRGGPAIVPVPRQDRRDRLSSTGSMGSSGSSLHAKTFGVDRTRLFVGSFNVDPRSEKLNTEMGVVIESRALANEIAQTFDQKIPANAYEVRLTEDGALEWIERREGHVIRYQKEPGTTWLQRATVRVLSWLPIEWLL